MSGFILIIVVGIAVLIVAGARSSANRTAPSLQMRQTPRTGIPSWLYAHLFAVTPYSARLWNGFCRFPLGREQLEFMQNADAGAIRERWFHTGRLRSDRELEDAADRLIGQVKEELAHAASNSRYRKTRWGSDNESSLLGLSAGMLFFSLMDSDNFDRQMGMAAGEDGQETRKPQDGVAGAVCAGTACSGGDNGGGSDSGSGSGCGGGGGGGSSCSGSGSSCSGGSSSCSGTSSSCSGGSSCSGSS